MNNLLFSFVSSLNLRLSKCIKWYQKSEPNWERSLQRTRFKHRVPQRNPTASKCRRMFCKAQRNTTFPSNYVEFPQTGMKVMMHEASNIPMRMCHVPNWCTCNPFHKRGRTCVIAPKKLTIQANAFCGSLYPDRENCSFTHLPLKTGLHHF